MGLNETFLKRMKDILSEEEYTLLLKEYDKKPTRAIRLNDIDINTIIKNTDMELEKIDYDIDGYYLLNDTKYGNNPYHHLGCFYFQEPSAMAPVNMYEFKGDEIVLDLCASPGGKSSQILKRIPNGVLFSNEINKKRSQILFSNLERLGFSNAVVLNETPQRLSNKLGGLFDVILVDAPCSGQGMIRKDEQASTMFNEQLVEECYNRDLEIINCADKMLKTNGVLIYSTCTFETKENEDIIRTLINDYNYELLLPNSLLKQHTKEGFVKNTLRFYPFTGKGEGQFMACLRKKSDSDIEYKFRNTKKLDKDIKIVKSFIDEHLSIDLNLDIIKEGNRYYACASNINLEGMNVLNFGIELGEVSNNRFIPYHHFYKTLGRYFKNKLVLDVNDKRVLKYIHGEQIQGDVKDGFGVIEVDGHILGGFKAKNNVLNNHYPKGLRNINILEE